MVRTIKQTNCSASCAHVRSTCRILFCYPFFPSTLSRLAVRKLCQVFAYRGYDQPRFREICGFYGRVFLLPLAEAPIQAGQGQQKVALKTPLIMFFAK